MAIYLDKKVKYNEKEWTVVALCYTHSILDQITLKDENGKKINVTPEMLRKGSEK